MLIFKFANAVFIVLLTSAAIFAQSSSDLRSKYGAPSEAYEVRPNVLMTVVFWANGQTREMIIEARHASNNSVSDNNFIPLSVAEEILSEVVPMQQKGKSESNFTFSSGCSSMILEEYENVSINIAERCLQGGGKAVVSIIIKCKHKQ